MFVVFYFPFAPFGQRVSVLIVNHQQNQMRRRWRRMKDRNVDVKRQEWKNKIRAWPHSPIVLSLSLSVCVSPIFCRVELYWAQAAKLMLDGWMGVQTKAKANKISVISFRYLLNFGLIPIMPFHQCVVCDGRCMWLFEYVYPMMVWCLPFNEKKKKGNTTIDKPEGKIDDAFTLYSFRCFVFLLLLSSSLSILTFSFHFVLMVADGISMSSSCLFPFSNHINL